MTYLVTGGAGFIGSHVAKCLLERGETVVVLDNFNDYYDPKIKRSNIAKLSPFERFTLIEGDIRDASLATRLFAKHGIRKVAHLGGLSNVRASIRQTPLYNDVNVNGTINLLEASAKQGIDQFVFASTSSVYGETNTLPFIETDSADKPLASYPASKRAGEMFAHTYHNLHQMNVACLRFFNVYGPAGRPDMMPMKLMHATQNGSEITIFGQGEFSTSAVAIRFRSRILSIRLRHYRAKPSTKNLYRLLRANHRLHTATIKKLVTCSALIRKRLCSKVWRKHGHGSANSITLSPDACLCKFPFSPRSKWEKGSGIEGQIYDLRHNSRSRCAAIFGRLSRVKIPL
jgi:dTDP-4-dehydrorhamnose reductase